MNSNRESQTNRQNAVDVDVEMVEGWGGELGVLQGRLRRYFARSETRHRAIAYIKGLLSDIPRKNGWQLAEQAGETTPDGMQRLLGSSVWDAEAVRTELQTYIVEALGETEAGLVVDEAGFLKQFSAGVKRQYSGTAGRIAN